MSLFREVSRRTVAFANLYHGRAAGIAFAGAGGDWEFRPEVTGGPHRVRLDCALGDAEATVWLDGDGWATAAAKVLDIPPHSVASVPEPLARAALECFFNDALAALEKGTGLPFALKRWEFTETPALRSAFFFSLTAPDGLSVRGAWVLAGGEDAWRALERALSSRPETTHPLPDAFPLTGWLSAGRWRMRAGALSGLEAGDVVVSRSGAEWQVIVGTKLCFAAAMAGGKIVVEGNSMSTLSEENETADGGDTRAAEDVEVEVQARVGTLTLTLAALRRLGAGQVVEFATPVQTPVTLTVSGQAIARGELLDVDGRVAVRITSMGN